MGSCSCVWVFIASLCIVVAFASMFLILFLGNLGYHITGLVPSSVYVLLWIRLEKTNRSGGQVPHGIPDADRPGNHKNLGFLGRSGF